MPSAPSFPPLVIRWCLYSRHRSYSSKSNDQMLAVLARALRISRNIFMGSLLKNRRATCTRTSLIRFNTSTVLAPARRLPRSSSIFFRQSSSANAIMAACKNGWRSRAAADICPPPHATASRVILLLDRRCRRYCRHPADDCLGQRNYCC